LTVAPHIRAPARRLQELEVRGERVEVDGQYAAVELRLRHQT
jgi:hypothetical protein